LLARKIGLTNSGPHCLVEVAVNTQRVALFVGSDISLAGVIPLHS
jgi:hypothetical protein